MQRLLVIAFTAAFLAGCGSPCEDLGDRLCRCNPTGVSTETCKRQVKNAVDDANPTKGEEERCADLLDSCHAPSGAEFCEWLSTADGKAACGLAY